MEGPKAGCGIYRFNADDLEAAISTAMIDFYANEPVPRSHARSPT
jgi:hypothetical protein